MFASDVSDGIEIGWNRKIEMEKEHKNNNNDYNDDLIDTDRLKNAAAPFLHTFLNCGGQQRIQHDLFSAVLLRRENRRRRFGSSIFFDTTRVKSFELSRNDGDAIQHVILDRSDSSFLRLLISTDTHRMPLNIKGALTFQKRSADFTTIVDNTPARMVSIQAKESEHRVMEAL